MSRDMSERQFKRSAERNGFRLGMLGLEHRWPDGSWTSYGYILDAKTFKVRRRSSLAKAINRREADEARREAS